MRRIPTLALAEIDSLLLRAALLDGPAARAAYDDLRARFDLDALDYGRQRLLPLLHRNLTGFGVGDPLLGRLRGVRHYHWAKNQVRVKAVAPLLADFSTAGIATVLLKGTALLATCVDDMSLRPMDDIDLLVPRERWSAALDVMAARGFKARGVDESYLRTEDDTSQPGWGFIDAQGIEVDVHSHLLRLDCREGADLAAWRRIRPATLAGQATAVLCPADQIVHAIAHAALWSADSILRWAADVVLILRWAGLAMDWEPLIEEARARRIAPPLHDGLAALRAHVGIDIPDGVLARLRGSGGPIERLEHRLRAQPLEARSRLAQALIDIFDMRRRRQSRMDRPLLASVIPYLRDRLAPRHIAHLAPLMIFAALGRPWWLRGLFGVDRWARQATFGAPATTPDAAATSSPQPVYLDGWSYPEANGRWSTRYDSRVAWRLPQDWRDGVTCTIEAMPFHPPGRAAARVDIWANDRLVASWRELHSAPRARRISVRVPREAIGDEGALIITFAVDRLRSPAQMGVAMDDPRPLGVYICRVDIAPLDAGTAKPRRPPGPLAAFFRHRLGMRGPAAIAALALFGLLGRPRALRRRLRIDRWARYVDAHRLPAIEDAFPPAKPAEADPCLDGWGPPEPGGRWTVAGEARAAWQLPPGFEGELECEVTAWTLAKLGLAPPTLAIWANDHQVALWQGGPVEAHRVDLRFRIPAAALRRAETLVCLFVVDPLRSPAELGLSADTRTLGLFVERIRFSRPAA